jgi:hypothetical protein
MADLPAGLRPPIGGDQVAVTYSADLGPLARVGDIAHLLKDLDDAVLLGEQWGIIIGRAASVQEVLDQLARRGPGAIEDAALSRGFRARDVHAIDEWIHTGYLSWRPGRFPFPDPLALVRALADYQTADRLGDPVRLRRLNYQNPLTVDLTGSGFLVAGVIYILRVIRDWSSSRRAAAAAADRAEAVADEARAGASIAWSQADILDWFANEARAGRWHVPPGDLLATVRPEDLAALNRLAAADVTLSLPQDLDPGQPEP